MLRKLILFTLVLTFITTQAHAQRQPGTVMLVVRTTDLVQGFDQAINDRLVSLGYTVTLVEDGLFNQATADSLVDYALLVVSESISSNDVNELADASRMINIDVPIMNMEPYSWDNIGIAGPADSNGTTLAGTDIEIIDDTHPVLQAAGIVNGVLSPYAGSSEALMIGKEASGFGSGVDILAIGTGPDSTFATMWAADTGAQLDVGTALNRMFCVFFQGREDGVTYPATDANDNYWDIFDQAVRWLDPLTVPPEEPYVGPIYVTNFSFELPGAETTDWSTVPGWDELDTANADSGIALPTYSGDGALATDGDWASWQGGPQAIQQVTTHTMIMGDVYRLTLDWKRNWESVILKVELFAYDDSAGAESAVLQTFTIEEVADGAPAVEDRATWNEDVTFQLSAPVDESLAGQLLGIRIGNDGPGSYLDIDNIRLEGTGSVNSARTWPMFE